jgi:hypothetical protein
MTAVATVDVPEELIAGRFVVPANAIARVPVPASRTLHDSRNNCLVITVSSQIQIRDYLVVVDKRIAVGVTTCRATNPPVAIDAATVIRLPVPIHRFVTLALRTDVVARDIVQLKTTGFDARSEIDIPGHHCLHPRMVQRTACARLRIG